MATANVPKDTNKGKKKARSEEVDESVQQEIFERLNHTEYKHWLLSAQALRSMKDALTVFIGDVIGKFHQELVGKHSQQTCSNEDCISKNIQFDKASKNWKLKAPCPNSICEKWLQDLVLEHTLATACSGVHFKNSTVHKWPIEQWEVAKVYMENLGGDASQIEGPTDCDASALLMCMTQCKRFVDAGVKGKKLEHTKKVKGIRNTVMHSANMSVSSQEFESYLGDICKLLNIIKELESSKESQEAAQKTLQSMQSIRNFAKSLKLVVEGKKPADDSEQELVYNLSYTEQATWKEKLNYMNYNLMDTKGNTLEETNKLRQEAFGSLKYLNEHPDLSNMLKDQVDDLFTKLEGRVKNVEDRMDRFDEELKTLKEGILNQRSPARGPGGCNFKNQLQTYCQSNGFQLPKYSTKSSVSGEGFFVEVEVNGKMYRSSSAFRRVKDAQMDAAELALKALGQLVLDEDAEKHQDQGCTIYQRMGKLKLDDEEDDSQNNIKMSEYTGNDHEEINKTYQDDLKFEEPLKRNGQYEVKLSYMLPGVIQYCSRESMNKKAASEEAAKLVLETLGQNGQGQSTSAKDVLYAYCGQRKVAHPQYENLMGAYGTCTFVKAGCITERHKAVFEGLGATEEEAKADAERKALIIMKQLGIEAKDDVSVDDEETVPSFGADAGQNMSYLSTTTEAVSNYKGKLLELQAQKVIQSLVWLEGGTGIRICHIFKPEPKQLFSTRKEAEKYLAAYALSRINDLDQVHIETASAKNVLQEYCQKNALPKPVYNTYSEGGRFTGTVQCEFIVRDSCSHSSKKAAEQHVAEMTLKVIAPNLIV